jgi:hypothetical protein
MMQLLAASSHTSLPVSSYEGSGRQTPVCPDIVAILVTKPTTKAPANFPPVEDIKYRLKFSTIFSEPIIVSN